MKRQNLTCLLAGASALLMISAAEAAFAAEAAETPAVKSMGSAGGEGTDVSEVVVTAERNQAAAEAPAKASLAQVQPEAIISRNFIEQVIPETGDYTTVVNIAPSMSGIGANGGGIGDYNKTTLRGFQDGFYNLTYDGISFGDTNNPTHHPADYFPASTIGAAVVDRGPGAAGDLGQANFGGAIHLFSMTPTDTFGAQQKASYGSFNTVDLVTTLNTGSLQALGGGKLLVNFNERQSDGELSHSGGNMANQLVKYVLPIGDRAVFTLFGNHEYTRFNLADAGPGETYQQTQLYGKNFALNSNPADEHYYGYNYEGKATDFYYADLKGQVVPSITAENQLYTYFYSNKTTAANDITGLIGGPNTSVLQNTVAANGRTATTNPNDIGGYDKLNQYRVWGDVVRINKEWSFGTLKIGGIVETSSTDRHNGFIDLSNGGAPDYKFQPLSKYPLLTAITNYKTQENSSWLQGQVFADFDWKPIDNLTLSPGVKFVDFTRKISAANESVAGASAKNEPLVAQNTYTKPLYFFTGNYKITPDWAVYAQVATSFLIPQLSDLATVAAASDEQSLQPDQTITYQGGTVYTHGNITADADVYRIDASNFEVACNIPNPIAGGSPTVASTCNAGNVRYTGVEGELAYHLPFGVTAFANGSLNTAKQLANAANPAEGISANPAQEMVSAPNSTAAVGALYNHQQWRAALTYKYSGTYVANYTSGGVGIREPGYDTFDGSIAYDFGHYAMKLQVSNLLDKRAITNYSGTLNLAAATQAQLAADTGLYTYQSGRQIMATLSAKF